MIADTIEGHGSVLAGYAHKAGADLWIDINGSFSKATSYKAGTAKYGYKADLAGVTIGADYALGNGVAFGGAFSFGTGSARGQGAGTGTKNDVDYYGLNLYGVLATDYVNVIGNIGYSIGKNEIKQSGATGKPDVKTLSLGVRAEKSLAVTDGFDVTPHIGIRYMNIDMDSFTAGGFKYSAKKANLAQVPFGVAFSGSFKASCGAAVKPFVDVTVAPAFGDKKVTNRFALAGGTSSDSIDARIANSSMYQGRIGLNAVKGSHSLGINYGVGGGNNGRVDQSLQARYRYSF
jgi:outer membrane autotransporter protein